jgi:hypothetical protein
MIVVNVFWIPHTYSRFELVLGIGSVEVHHCGHRLESLLEYVKFLLHHVDYKGDESVSIRCLYGSLNSATSKGLDEGVQEPEGMQL